MKRPLVSEFLRFRGRRILLALVMLLAGAGSLPAATYYVDGNCPTGGNGTSSDCLASPTSNPKKTIAEGVALLTAPGDKLRVRGAHAAHGAETGNFDGRYFSTVDVNNKSGTSASSIIIEAYGWTAIGARTQEMVSIDAAVPPSPGSPTLGWTQCQSCPAGSGSPSGTTCPGVPGVCSDVWYVLGSGAYYRAEGAVKLLGDPAFRVNNVADLTNANAGYNPARCSNETWRVCRTNADCQSGGTCTASSPEIDSFTCNNQAGGCATAYIYARWGSGANAPGGANNPRPYLLTSTVGTGFRILGSSSFVEIRGFITRNTRDSGIAVTGNAHDIVLKDNVVAYAAGIPSGGDYGMCACGGDNVTIVGNEILHTQSESIHTQAQPGDVPTHYSIVNNYIHDIGNQSVSGPAALGTPTCFTLTDSGSGGGGAGNYSGSVVDGNLFLSMTSNLLSYCINLENNSDGWTIRNNIFKDISAECIRFNAGVMNGVVGSNDNLQVYNNLLINCGNGSSGQAAILVFPSATTVTANNNVIVNNTIINPRYPGIGYAGPGPATGNIIRNNVLYSSGNQRLVNWAPTDTTNVFTNNLVYAAGLTSGGTLATWRGTNYSCTAGALPGLSAIDATNLCANPAFVNISGLDFHLGAGSSAINKGTDNGVPTGRLSIYNLQAALHGLPDYREGASKAGAAWDLGVAEFGGSALSAAISLRSPTPGGSVPVTVTTSVPVVQLPGPLVFRESDGTITNIILSGTVPGSSFAGTFVVDSTVAEGLGTFSLPVGSLVDGSGNLSNTISSGGSTLIDRTAPAAPLNPRVGG